MKSSQCPKGKENGDLTWGGSNGGGEKIGQILDLLA